VEELIVEELNEEQRPMKQEPSNHATSLPPATIMGQPTEEQSTEEQLTKEQLTILLELNDFLNVDDTTSLPLLQQSQWDANVAANKYFEPRHRRPRRQHAASAPLTTPDSMVTRHLYSIGTSNSTACRIYPTACRIYTIAGRLYTIACRIYLTACRIYTIAGRLYTIACRLYPTAGRLYTAPLPVAACNTTEQQLYAATYHLAHLCVNACQPEPR
jgi:hypothetical protein